MIAYVLKLSNLGGKNTHYVEIPQQRITYQTTQQLDKWIESFFLTDSCSIPRLTSVHICLRIRWYVSFKLLAKDFLIIQKKRLPHLISF